MVRVGKAENTLNAAKAAAVIDEPGDTLVERVIKSKNRDAAIAAAEKEVQSAFATETKLRETASARMGAQLDVKAKRQKSIGALIKKNDASVAVKKWSKASTTHLLQSSR
jgi:hypothetical protein